MTRQILIVEDEQLLLRTLTKALCRATSYEVAGVETVSAARETLEHFRPHLMICDLALGDGSGLEVIDLLRRHGLAIPIIILSGQLALYERSLPTNDRIVVRHKPLPARELLELVDTTLALSDIEGSSGAFSVADYLQMAQYGRRSLRVEVRCGRWAGSITTWQGEVWSARIGKMRGQTAVARMLAPNALALHTTPVVEPPGEREIDLPTHALLIELARIHDEAVRTSRGDTDPEPEGARNAVEDHLRAFVKHIADDRPIEAAEALGDARSVESDDMRTTAWWCDALIRRWTVPTSLPNGGAA